jgi:hypothetical protein
MAHNAGVEQRILTAIKQDQHLASLTVVRAAIADVLDAGCSCTNEKHSWELDDITAEELGVTNGQLVRFIDAVCQRIAQLQQEMQREHPPLRSLTEAAEDTLNAAWAQSPPSMRNYVERDVAQFFYLLGQRDGLAVAAETLNGDLREIGRLAKERL